MSEISAIPSGIWNKISFRLSSSNISKGWKITRNIAGGIFVIGSLLTGPVCPIVFSAEVSLWIGWITLVSGVVSGRAQLDTSKKK
jgi:hypothetical protein